MCCLFGYFFFSGQLHLLISEHQEGRHQHLSQNVISKIIDLKTAAHNASDVAMESVRIDDSKYFNDFSTVVTSPWTVTKPHRRLASTLRWEIPQYKAKAHGKSVYGLSGVILLIKYHNFLSLLYHSLHCITE